MHALIVFMATTAFVWALADMYYHWHFWRVSSEYKRLKREAKTMTNKEADAIFEKYSSKKYEDRFLAQLSTDNHQLYTSYPQKDFTGIVLNQSVDKPEGLLWVIITYMKPRQLMKIQENPHIYAILQEKTP